MFYITYYYSFIVWHLRDVEPHNKHNDVLCFRYELHCTYNYVLYQSDDGLFCLKYEAFFLKKRFIYCSEMYKCLHEFH
jgi:hypothetical protein